MNKLFSTLATLATLALTLGLLLAEVPSALASAPALLPFQGFLTDSAGAPIDKTLQITFTIYDDSLAGRVLYAQSQTVRIDRGFFNAYIGTTGSNNALDPTIFNTATPLYLGIRVATDTELTPRTRLASVPYALYANACGDALSVGGQSPSAFAPAVHATAWSSLTDVPAGLADGDNDTLYTAANGGGLTLSGANAFSIAAGGVTSSMIGAGQVQKTHLATSAVATAALEDAAVTSAKLASSAVSTTAIADSAVTGGKLHAGAVTSSAIANGAVGPAQLTLPSGSVPIHGDLQFSTTNFLPTAGNSLTAPADMSCLVTVSFNAPTLTSATDIATVNVLSNVGNTLTAGSSVARVVPVPGRTFAPTATTSEVFTIASGSIVQFGCRVTTSAGSDLVPTASTGAAVCDVSWVCF